MIKGFAKSINNNFTVSNIGIICNCIFLYDQYKTKTRWFLHYFDNSCYKNYFTKCGLKLKWISATNCDFEIKKSFDI